MTLLTLTAEDTWAIKDACYVNRGHNIIESVYLAGKAAGRAEAIAEAARVCDQTRPRYKMPQMIDEETKQTILDEQRGEVIGAELCAAAIRKLA